MVVLWTVHWKVTIMVLLWKPHFETFIFKTKGELFTERWTQNVLLWLSFDFICIHFSGCTPFQSVTDSHRRRQTRLAHATPCNPFCRISSLTVWPRAAFITPNGRFHRQTACFLLRWRTLELLRGGWSLQCSKPVEASWSWRHTKVITPARYYHTASNPYLCRAHTRWATIQTPPSHPSLQDGAPEALIPEKWRPDCPGLPDRVPQISQMTTCQIRTNLGKGTHLVRLRPGWRTHRRRWNL